MTDYLYQFDPTSTANSNLVSNEIHALSTTNGNAIVAEQGLFYTKSLVIIIPSTNAILNARTDFVYIGFDSEITALTGQEVAAGIFITNPAITGPITINYQCVGGMQGNSNALVVQLRDMISSLANKQVAWGDVQNKPSSYPPAVHEHNILTDLDGLGTLRDMFTDIYDAIAGNRVPILSGQSIQVRMNNLINIVSGLQNSVTNLSGALGNYLAGVTGPMSATGPFASLRGSTGSPGPQGLSIIGPTGAIGPQGNTGSIGPVGPTGAQGLSITGPTGPVGPTGTGNLGSMQSGVWFQPPSIFRLVMIGTGQVVIDSKNIQGSVKLGLYTYVLANETDRIEYPFIGNDAMYIRATLTGTAAVQVI